MEYSTLPDELLMETLVYLNPCEVLSIAKINRQTHNITTLRQFITNSAINNTLPYSNN